MELINFIHQARRSGKTHKLVEMAINRLITTDDDNVGILTKDIENVVGIVTCNLNINIESVKITKSKKVTTIEFDIDFIDGNKKRKKIIIYTFFSFINEEKKFCLFPKKINIMLDEFPFEMHKDNSNKLFRKLEILEAKDITCFYTSELFLLNKSLFNLYNNTQDKYIDELAIMFKNNFTDEEFARYKNIRKNSCYKNNFFKINISEKISNNYFVANVRDISEIFKYDFMLTTGDSKLRARDYYGFLFKSPSIKVLETYNNKKIENFKQIARGDGK